MFPGFIILFMKMVSLDEYIKLYLTCIFKNFVWAPQRPEFGGIMATPNSFCCGNEGCMEGKEMGKRKVVWKAIISNNVSIVSGGLFPERHQILALQIIDKFRLVWRNPSYRRVN